MITCPKIGIEQTLSYLQDAGRRNKECVVLWLGKRHSAHIEVRACYLPLQIAEVDVFRIPPNGMSALQAKLRADRLMVAAQVHSHPQNAFHSKADDKWAIVRHSGALSLVVPRFAVDTSSQNFLDQTKVYQFSDKATWDEVPGTMVGSCLKIL